MTILRLPDIDFTQYRNIDDWTLRGNGKTTARLIKLLSRLRKDNYNKNYMFVTETREHAKHCKQQFEIWVFESHHYTIVGDCITVLFPRETPTLMENIVGIIKLTSPHKPDNIISFTFIGAGGYKQELRGRKRFDEILFDVSNEGYRNNFESLHNIMKLSSKLYE